MKSYGELKDEIDAIQQQILKGSLAEGTNKS